MRKEQKLLLLKHFNKSRRRKCLIEKLRNLNNDQTLLKKPESSGARRKTSVSL